MSVFYVKADTPAQFRSELVKWLNDLASVKRREASMSSRKRTKAAAENAARVYEAASAFWAEVNIVPLATSADVK